MTETYDHTEGLEKARQLTMQDCSGFSAPVCTSAVCGTHTDNLIAHALYINVRDGEIVGTPFGPEIPNGRYVWIADLQSAARAAKES